MIVYKSKPTKMKQETVQISNNKGLVKQNTILKKLEYSAAIKNENVEPHYLNLLHTVCEL